MDSFSIDSENWLVYDYRAPTWESGVTFVFFNALSGTADMWREAIAQPLADAGHGWLLYNLRGQEGTGLDPAVIVDLQLIVDDAVALMSHAKPLRPVYVGLSIGGLFAARVHLDGVPCAGLVFLNTLRKGPRLDWINAAVARAAEIDGSALLMDMYAPLLFNQEWQAENRSNALADTGDEPIDTTSGAYRLWRAALPRLGTFRGSTSMYLHWLSQVSGITFFTSNLMLTRSRRVYHSRNVWMSKMQGTWCQSNSHRSWSMHLSVSPSGVSPSLRPRGTGMLHLSVCG